jgi:hypothetical protein
LNKICLNIYFTGIYSQNKEYDWYFFKDYKYILIYLYNIEILILNIFMGENKFLFYFYLDMSLIIGLYLESNVFIQW